MYASLLAVVAFTPPRLAGATADDHCGPGETAMFRAGFLALSDQLGATMGIPSSCEYSDPAGTGDVEQDTTTGLAFWRKSTNTPSFTDGFNHWALAPERITRWTGSSIDPPLRATDNNAFSPFVGVWIGHGRALEVLNSGEAHFSYRTYRVCGADPPPCDSLIGNAISDGGRITVQLESSAPAGAFGTVVSSTDSTYPAGSAAMLELSANDILNVRIGNRDFATFCGDAAPLGYCGA
jgi:hypothetical protein